MKKQVLRILLVCTALVVLVPLIASVFRSTTGIGSGAASTLSSTKETEKETEKETSSVQRVDVKNIPHVIRELGSFTSRQNIHREYVLVEASLSDDVVFEIAQQLHAHKPQVWYYLMDSDSEFDTMLKVLPETEQNNYTNWPYSYVENHYVARVMQEIRTDDDGAAHRVWLIEGGAVRSSLRKDLE